MGWFDSIEHNRWLSAQMQDLIDVARGATVPTGFAHLDAEGRADMQRPVDLAITARMTYVFSLGTLMGIPGCRRHADHGVRALTRCFADPVNGGWMTLVGPESDAEGHGVPWDGPEEHKSQLHHAFLILGAAAAAVASRPGAHELLVSALHDQERHWLRPDGLVADTLGADHSPLGGPMTLGALVHTVEAYLAAAEATTDPVWVERAEAMTRFVHDRAAEADWRLGEYFDEDWNPIPIGTGASTPPDVTWPDVRRTYRGSVIGHSMQWARLALQVRAALRSMGRPQPAYLLEMAQEMFERARVDGWRRNGEAGFALTVDREGFPLETGHLQWVACEGVCATVAVRRALLDDGAGQGDVEHYAHCYRSWLDYLHDHVIAAPGVWVGALDEHNQPVARVGSSEPVAAPGREGATAGTTQVAGPVQATPSRSDVYHAVQTLLMPRVPLWPPFASAISRGLLDKPAQPPADRRSWNVFTRR